VGDGLYERLREVSIAVYERIAERAATTGLIVADTKFEFGFDRETKDLTLIDEVGTPDSSRFWPADAFEPGHTQPSFDKQYVRDWLDASGWNHEPPPPALPDDVVAATAAKYREAYERISGESFDAYRDRMGVQTAT
jgi:phosphoribosylaminoimidazole-succinocarboxamide synthase